MKLVGIVDIEYTKLYKKVITDGKMAEHIEEHGEEIHHSGTVELMVYENEIGDIFSVRLDVLDDLKTPSFHVKKNHDDEYLDIFDNIGEAEEDFYNIIKMD